MAVHDDCVSFFQDTKSDLVAFIESAKTSCSSFDRPLPSSFDANTSYFMNSALIECRLRLMVILLKTCDLSNEIRPPAIADRWLDCLHKEFGVQVNSSDNIYRNLFPSRLKQKGSLVFQFSHSWMNVRCPVDQAKLLSLIPCYFLYYEI